MTPWWAYLSRHMAAREWTAADLSRASGIDQSVIGRWRDRNARPSPENVRRAARGLGRDIREAIVAAGHYSAEELAERDRVAALAGELDLSAVTHERLAREVLTRMHAGAATRRPAERAGTPVSVAANEGHDVTEVQRERLDVPQDRTVTR